MNKVYAKAVQVHRNAWVNHLKKVMHNPETNGVSPANVQQYSVFESALPSNRRERRFHQDSWRCR